MIPDSMLNKKVIVEFTDWSTASHRKEIEIHLRRFPIKIDADLQSLADYPPEPSRAPLFARLFSNPKPGDSLNYIYGNVEVENYWQGSERHLFFPWMNRLIQTDDLGNYKIQVPDSMLNKKIIVKFSPSDGPMFQLWDQTEINLTNLPKRVDLVHPPNRGWHQ